MGSNDNFMSSVEEYQVNFDPVKYLHLNHVPSLLKAESGSWRRYNAVMHEATQDQLLKGGLTLSHLKRTRHYLFERDQILKLRPVV